MRGLKANLLLAFSMFVLFSPPAYAQDFSVLYDFGSGGSQDPVHPSYSGIIAQGRDGNLYSTSPSSVTGYGAAFMITASGALTVLYPFTSDDSGVNPESGLVLGTDGNFYGTTEYGESNYGTIFTITPNGEFTLLYSFTGGSDGGRSFAPPIQARDGNLYGTTSQGYTGSYYGTVYKLTPAGVVTPLYQFDDAHGASPFAPLVQGSDGNFFGTTFRGGNFNLGVVFKITSSGKLHVLYNLEGTHGSYPFGPLVEGNDGNFYGTTFNGGTHNSGVIFRIKPKGGLKVVHNFVGSGGGFYPSAGLVQASDGNLYGTTHSGGPVDAGTIFRITLQGKYTDLFKFDGTNGKFPLVTLTQHTNGILYGDTKEGGTGCQDCGTFYSLDLGLPPFVSLAPISGKVGDTVEMLGQGFTGTTGVSFSGTAASFNVVSDTFLTATVPNGATTGFVTVTRPGGPLKSNRKFHVRK